MKNGKKKQDGTRKENRHINEGAKKGNSHNSQ
jgi:hypothetical protein